MLSLLYPCLLQEGLPMGEELQRHLCLEPAAFGSGHASWQVLKHISILSTKKKSSTLVRQILSTLAFLMEVGLMLLIVHCETVPSPDGKQVDLLRAENGLARERRLPPALEEG